MDTLKDKQAFDDMHSRGEVPWEVWRSAPGSAALACVASTLDRLDPPFGERAVSRRARGRSRDRLRRDDTPSRAGADAPAFTWVVFSSDAVRGEEALRSAEALLRDTPDSANPHRAIPRRLPSVRRRAREGGVRAAEGDVVPRPRLDPLPKRPPPGPSTDLRAHLEYLPRSLDSRVRGTEIRRRPRRSERLRSARREPSVDARSRRSSRGSRARAASAGFPRTSFAGCCDCAASNAMLPAVTPKRSIVRKLVFD